MPARTNEKLSARKVVAYFRATNGPVGHYSNIQQKTMPNWTYFREIFFFAGTKNMTATEEIKIICKFQVGASLSFFQYVF